MSWANQLMRNCFVRFCLVAHFEVMICACITLGNSEVTESIWWFFSFSYVVASVVTTVYFIKAEVKAFWLYEQLSTSALDGSQIDAIANEKAS